MEPTLPENVGSVARVMDNLGTAELRLVNPCDHLSPAALSLATNSVSVLQTARVFPALADAVADRQFIIGTSSRRRPRHARPLPLPEILSLLPPPPARLAVVFGRENSGLTNDELALCSVCVHIPTFGATASLNLSHAVAIVLYELARQCPAPTATSVAQPPARAGEMDGLKTHLFDLLDTIGFLKPGAEASIQQSFADLLGRARPTEFDVRLLRGFLHRVQVTLHRAGQENGCDADIRGSDRPPGGPGLPQP